MARFVSLHDPPKISVLVSYWFRTVRTGHGPAGDNHPSAVLKSFILFFPYWFRTIRTGFGRFRTGRGRKRNLCSRKVFRTGFSYWL